MNRYACLSLAFLGTSTVLATGEWEGYFKSESGTSMYVYHQEPNIHRISYTTSVSGEVFQGTANLSGSFLEAVGTFTDKSSRRTCKGQMSITRPTWSSIQATWKVTSGTNCRDIGKTFNMTLSEPLPQANAAGDFMESAVRIHPRTLWNSWKVVSSDGSLNCRKTPNGALVHIFSAHEYLNVIDFTLSSGKPWFKVSSPSQDCYVRAHQNYIMPESYLGTELPVFQPNDDIATIAWTHGYSDLLVNDSLGNTGMKTLPKFSIADYICGIETGNVYSCPQNNLSSIRFGRPFAHNKRTQKIAFTSYLINGFAESDIMLVWIFDQVTGNISPVSLPQRHKNAQGVWQWSPVNSQTLPMGFSTIEGLDFASDGRLVVRTSNAAGDSATAIFNPNLSIHTCYYTNQLSGMEHTGLCGEK